MGTEASAPPCFVTCKGSLNSGLGPNSDSTNCAAWQLRSCQRFEPLNPDLAYKCYLMTLLTLLQLIVLSFN